ncbi:hypothetical protein THRCLA_23429, partial [Thraustotheca clavata]
RVASETVTKNLPVNNEGQYSTATPHEYTQIVANYDIEAPKLVSCDIEEMKKFWLDWQRRTLRLIWRQGGNSNPGHPILTDSKIYAYFKTDCELSTAAISTFQSRVKRELRCDVSIKDGASRILCMASTYDKICHEAGFVKHYDAEIEAA